MAKIFTFLIVMTFNSAFSQLQIGDSGWTFNEKCFDARFPAMREWAKAGVVGGIPVRNTLKIKKTISPNSNLQQAIDEVSSKGGGVILLKKGEYIITQTCFLKSNVVLRGEEKDKTVLKIMMKKMFFKYALDKQQLTALEVNDLQNVGFEDLTIRYAAANFEPYDKPNFNDAWDRRVFHQPETRDTTLFVHLLIFRRCKNCWVDNCNFLNAGTHPLGVGNCQHITLRNNFIDRAYVKNDSFHGGYYGCWGSSYCLFYHEKVRRIRHFAIMSKGAAYNVVLNCDFEVDVNFHDEDDGNNLVENCRIATPVWHSWYAIGIGDPKKHHPPGPNNILFNNKAISKGIVGYNLKMGVVESDVIYQVSTEFGTSNIVKRNDTPPKCGTFYAIKRSEK